MMAPTKEDAQAFFELSSQFVNLANQVGEEHGKPRASAAILWAASRYCAFTWMTSHAGETQTPEEALDLFCAQYRRMLEDNLRLMREQLTPPPG
jgi:hypothetical protein